MILPTPLELRKKFPLTSEMKLQIDHHKQSIQNILEGKDDRIAIVLGPCSIHDKQSMLSYARLIKTISSKIDKHCFITLRAYVEKPRTSLGWKGFLYDPDLKGTSDLYKGLHETRTLFLELLKLGLPLSMEFLDPLASLYFEDVISWGFIGARTCTSSIHRQMASALPMPIGFKHTTDGCIDNAIHGMINARSAQDFLSLNSTGLIIQKQSNGNPYTHLVLRGSDKEINYDNHSVHKAIQTLQSNSIYQKILIDCSHGNSQKDHKKQSIAFENILKQITSGNRMIAGMMLESFIKEGNQSFPSESIDPELSITDSCIDFGLTEKLLLSASHAMSCSTS